MMAMSCVTDETGVSARSKGVVTLVNLQRQLATPIRNACFSHEFADTLHF